VLAKDLKPAYRLQTADHRDATVTTTRIWTQHERVYNLTVDTLHTYFVQAGETPMLVHNCGEQIYDAGGKHGAIERSSSRGTNSKEPANGQVALDNSVQIKPTSPRRIGYSEGDVVILDPKKKIIIE
jgi:hypothetical protein